MKSLTILVYYRLLAKAFLWQVDRVNQVNFDRFLDDCDGGHRLA